MKKGLLSNVLAWLSYPLRSQITFVQWGLGLIVVLIAGFLWSTVITEIKR